MGSTNNDSSTGTKQRILDFAAGLFAEKGFTETSTRELAEAVGLNPASMYYYFPSKTAILEHMIEDYSKHNSDVFKDKNLHQILEENPTADGILSCLQLSFPEGRQEYYVKVLCVLLQEQLRNPIVRAYISDRIILNAERNVRTIIDVLIELGFIHREINHDYWMKAHSSFLYSFASRMMLGIGDNSEDFTGMSMADMLRFNFNMMFEKCGTAKAIGA